MKVGFQHCQVVVDCLMDKSIMSQIVLFGGHQQLTIMRLGTDILTEITKRFSANILTKNMI